MAGIEIDGVNNKIDFDDDKDTSISANVDDTLVIESGGANVASITSGEFAINDDQANIDFRVESDSNTHMFFVDAENNEVGINTSTAESTFHVISTGTNSAGKFECNSANNPMVILNNSRADDGSEISLRFDRADTVQGAIGTTGQGISFWTNSSLAERMRINSSGYVGINNTNPSATLEVHTNNNITAFETQPKVNQTYYAALFRNSSGNDVGQIESTASSTTFATSSDYRLKENVDYTWDATTRLKQLKPVRFNWIVDDTNTLVDGFLAHEVSSIVPEAISGEKDGTETRTKVVLDASGNQLARNVEESDWIAGKEDETFPSDSTWEASKVCPKHQAIDHSKLIPLMVKTIQELEARIKELEGN